MKEYSQTRTQIGNFRRCEQINLQGNVTCDGNIDGTTRSSCIVSNRGDEEIIQEACAKVRYKLDVINYLPDEYESVPSILNRVLTYFTEVVYGSSPDVTDVLEREADLRDYVLLQGIFPGTRWCGFGNLADDIHTNVGEHQRTDSCCRSHDLCEPKVRALQKRYYYNNQGIIPISHCSCDVDFYNCLKGVNSPVSNKIGRIFFNIVKIKCFDFAVSDVCTLELMGVCLTRGQKCAAVLKGSPYY
ncbi:Phospholipase A2 isozymes PA3A/PA3B/PA5 [Mizuhopecten yessoensis]|uniref:Phospholipase A2 isozymes PA3A/PA3B/PA5 n=2 Tax=Mizuhopecten yessoensis TaxID=6573 RepID=A0A210Q6H1_MIZYE|nr:Phospholipase A2 isozymes PA3A/PA3B/PA5 [Mizuhopecten yessoensis]